MNGAQKGISIERHKVMKLHQNDRFRLILHRKYIPELICSNLMSIIISL